MADVKIEIGAIHDIDQVYLVMTEGGSNISAGLSADQARIVSANLIEAAEALDNAESNISQS